MMLSLKTILLSMANQETGVRGYLVSGKDDFLAPYHNGIKDYESSFAQVKELTADNPAQQTRLAALNDRALGWRNDVAEKVIALTRDSKTVEEARAMEARGAGKTYMDGLRGLINEIQDAERSLIIERSAAGKAAVSSSDWISIGGLVGMSAFALIAGFALYRGIAAPIANTTHTMRALADGNLDVAVPFTDLRNELGEMARAVEVFKQNGIKVREMNARESALQAKSADSAIKHGASCFCGGCRRFYPPHFQGLRQCRPQPFRRSGERTGKLRRSRRC
ncbi:CHASE3 domain sensor protein [Rhizobium paranaense]|uniref:CHASE3 domain sensor protein n=1 Tax=Rhizobium paranaense TaxID=1650438 RepID=A0A7W8XY41_9HYPH|nr:CHASE3 domain sensor protein [Rhizobium paranaense]